MTFSDALLATELRLGAFIGRPLSPSDWAAVDRLSAFRLGLLAERERPLVGWDGRGDVVARFGRVER
jgi:hypothetical protein